MGDPRREALQNADRLFEHSKTLRDNSGGELSDRDVIMRQLVMIGVNMPCLIIKRPPTFVHAQNHLRM